MKTAFQTSSLLLVLFTKASHAYEDICSPFQEIYADGTELCEVMWDGAFEVVDDSVGYSFWFFDAENNPNDAMTRDLLGSDTVADQCHLNYFHKQGSPSPEGDGMQECHPWKENSCCHSDTVKSVEQINEGYGAGFEWDRCGPMTQACERFFVMEACFYECEPAAGLYRKFEPLAEGAVKPDGYNEWQIEKMPIKKSFCDAWYTACRDDYFCGKGNFWDCEAHYKTNLAAQEKAEAEDEDKGLVIGLSIGFSLAALAVMTAFFLIYREKKGVPVFSPAEAQGGVSS